MAEGDTGVAGRCATAAMPSAAEARAVAVSAISPRITCACDAVSIAPAARLAAWPLAVPLRLQE
eukprot:scaffold7703_cov103-Isochrysis_galbana.AAC.6